MIAIHGAPPAVRARAAPRPLRGRVHSTARTRECGRGRRNAAASRRRAIRGRTRGARGTAGDGHPQADRGRAHPRRRCAGDTPAGPAAGRARRRRDSGRAPRSTRFSTTSGRLAEPGCAARRATDGRFPETAYRAARAGRRARPRREAGAPFRMRGRLPCSRPPGHNGPGAAARISRTHSPASASTGGWGAGPERRARNGPLPPATRASAAGREEILVVAAAARDDEHRPSRAVAQANQFPCASRRVASLPARSRERRRRGRLEQVRRRELPPEPSPRRVSSSTADKRVAAELEEIVVAADTIEAEHLRKRRGHRLLALARGSAECHVEVGAGRPGRGQRLAVHLPGRRPRQGAEAHDRRRNHGGRQSARKRPAQSSERRFSAPPRRRRRRPVPTAIHARGGVAHSRNGQERGLDLAGLDAVAADLETFVPAAEMQEAAIRQETAEIARLEHPDVGPSRHGHEGRGRAFGILPVADRQRPRHDGDLSFIPVLRRGARPPSRRRRNREAIRPATACRVSRTTGASRPSRSTRDRRGRRSFAESGCDRDRDPMASTASPPSLSIRSSRRRRGRRASRTGSGRRSARSDRS